MAGDSLSCVYWLHDSKCICPWRHGYVGVTAKWALRFKQHRVRFREFRWAVLFIGTETECYALEEQLRPTKSIGWNLDRGGFQHPTAGMNGKSHSEETRAKMRARAFARPPISEETRRKRATRSMLGKKHSEATLRKMSESAKRRGPTYVMSDEEKQRRRMRWLGNSLTKGQPWSTARRLAWLNKQQPNKH